MRKLFLFLGLIGSSSFANNQFMHHLIEPWYETEDIEKKRDIGNEIIRLMDENDYGKIASDGIRDGDGG